MKLEFLGGVGEVGRSALLVNDSLLLDFGLLADSPLRQPIRTPVPDAVVVSHGHLDHVGALPALLSGTARPSIHWTPPTREFATTLARDTLKLHGNTPQCPFTAEDVRRLAEVSVTHGYRDPFEAAGHRIEFFDAGHIPGSAHVLVQELSSNAENNGVGCGRDGTRLLYTGDFYALEQWRGDKEVRSTDQRTEDATGDRRRDSAGNPIYGQRLVPESTARPEADVVICESTYSNVEHEPRSRVESRFVERVRSTLWEGGTAIVPAFAIGRTQELLLVCDAYDIPCYVDGMGTAVTEMLTRYPEFVRDPEALRRAKSHARFVNGRNGQRRRIVDQPVAIVTTSGMLTGGPAMTYVPEIRGNPTNTIALTGYQVEGTPGRDLLETGRAEIDGRVMPVAARVERFDFSAHADQNGLRSFLDAYRDARILVTHGDRCETFADELRADGFAASAPSLGSIHHV